MKYKKKLPIYIGTLNNFNKNAAGEYRNVDYRDLLS